MGARVMVHWLRVLLVLVEDPSSMPCTHVVAHNYPLLWSREFNVLFKAQGTWCTFMQAKHLHT